MNDPQSQSRIHHSMSARERVDQACDEFERQWRAGDSPQIESFLAGAEVDDRPLLLRELIALELSLRDESGHNADPQEYRNRFAADLSIVDSAIECFRKRETKLVSQNGDSGDAPAMESTADDEIPRSIGRNGRYRIIRVLGRGGFATVYLARDTDLDREVALKVPRLERFDSAEALEFFVDEARKAAQLDHPRIVRVHDVQRDPDLVYIVQQYLAGGDLSQHTKSRRLPHRRIAELMISIAEAVGYAHQRGYVHLDLKPGNILLDEDGNLYVADFGLALHETMQRGKKGQVFGTYLYMSPEQARGEIHRLDGRSDIWSLGVILYELLTGRRPFVGESRTEITDEVEHRNPKPPRQVDPRVPKELARICLVCLSKLATDRYSSAADLVDDLRLWLEDKPVDAIAAESLSNSIAPAPAKIIPQGLRSFEAEHADFYLELLPGPHDREGLPKSIRFWKTQIEKAEPDETFSVGLMYGPSGCGKSSLVKAGLLPRLSDQILPVLIEATAADTEVRLIKTLRKRCPGLPPEGSLPELISAIRENGGADGRKIVIVLDQFEQWLHTNQLCGESQLLPALRQCDGVGVQCLLMVRDDFWMSATRFMKALEVPLVEGFNSEAADLFDSDHAEKVLAAFGRAYGKVPDLPAEPSLQQRLFLKSAVEGLSDDGKSVCVRLAVFAEMMKGRPWTEEALAEVGGTEGVGVAFLEQTLSAKTAPPLHRLHQKAACAVLKALLPDQGTDIKGQMRSYGELLETSGYKDRPDDFGEVLGILDNEVRLITPTDPDDDIADNSKQGRFYQLTHDYLVSSLREWLRRRMSRSRSGRAKLQLAERASIWESKPERRHLPSSREYLRFKWHCGAGFTRREINFMSKADRYYRVLFGYIGLMAVAVIALCFYPMNFSIIVRGTVQPSVRRAVFAETPGEVIQLLVDSSDLVTKGDTLVVLRNVEIESELTAIERQLNAAKSRKATLERSLAEISNENAKGLSLESELERCSQQIHTLEAAGSVLHRKFDSLTIRSPIDGFVVPSLGHDIDIEADLRGRKVIEGKDLLTVIAPDSSSEVRLFVPQRHMRHVEAQFGEGDDPFARKIPVSYFAVAEPRKIIKSQFGLSNAEPDLSTESQVFKFEDDQHVGGNSVATEIQARIDCGSRPLGYVLTSEALDMIRLWLNRSLYRSDDNFPTTTPNIPPKRLDPLN